MSKEEILKIQTCVLKVNIHCDGCEHKVRKILQKIDGVYKTRIDPEVGRVTVYGIVDPATLIKKLGKNGKYAELWGVPKHNQNHLNDQFKNMQMDSGKGNKGQKAGNNQPKGGGGGQNNQFQQQLQQFKGLQDLKLPQFKGLKLPFGKDQNQKTVRFDLPDDDELTDDEFDGEDDFDDDDLDDEMDDAPIHPLNKVKHNMMPNMMMMMKGQHPQAKPSNGGNNGKKDGGGGGSVPIQVSGGKKGGGGNGGNNQNQVGGGGKGGGKTDGKSGGGAQKNGNNGGSGGGGNNNGNGGKKGGGMNYMTNIGGMGQMSQMGMGQIPAVQGLPATAMSTVAGGGGGGYLGRAGLEGMAGNPYYQQQQQQQLAAMMMNQQRAAGNERFQPMMYARQPAAVNYMPQYPSPYSYPYQYAQGDQYTHVFSDENTSSCSVM